MFLHYYVAEAYKAGQLQEVLEKAVCSWGCQFTEAFHAWRFALELEFIFLHVSDMFRVLATALSVIIIECSIKCPSYTISSLYEY